MWPEAESQPVGHDWKDRASRKAPERLPHCPAAPTPFSHTCCSHVCNYLDTRVREGGLETISSHMNATDLITACPGPNRARVFKRRMNSVMLWYWELAWGNIYQFQQLEWAMLLQFSPILICISPTLPLRTFLKSTRLLQFFKECKWYIFTMNWKQ